MWVHVILGKLLKFNNMKKIVALCFFAVLFAGCDYHSSQTVTYSINEPVVMSAAEFRNSVRVTNDVHELSDYGKICFYEGYLYISEPGKGIHIVDNTNTSSPKITGYIELLGNADLAIRNGLLYADALVDLVWFDISNPSKPALKGRLENVFPEILPPTENDYGYDYLLCQAAVEKKNIVTGWTVKKRTEDVNNYSYPGRGWLYNEKWVAFTDGGVSPNSGSNGVNGSMSRFGLYQDYLYTINNYQMVIFDLSGVSPQKAVENIPIGWNVETIFSYQDKMFMGTPTGLLIYSVENPLDPTYCSSISHVFGCDPVVVENDLAYVTVHSGNFCGQNNNDLFIVDVSNVYQPKQIASFAMKNPKGLGIDNSTLFLCDDGLKIFKVGDNPQTLIANELAHYTGMDGYDVIPYNNTLMMIADNGLYQYDYSDINAIKKLSVLPIFKKD
jgi:hypothetical protein